MVAGTGRDVRITALSWEATVRVFHTRSGPTALSCPADTGPHRLVTALCAQYVPKFFARRPAC
jgi:hypothetical protein